MNTTNQKSLHREELTPQADAPKVPTSFDELGVPRAVVENLLIKHIAAYPKSDLLNLTQLMCINSHLIEAMIGNLRKKSLVEVFQ
ncbi:AAA family ATPase, partial [Vibrio genomosp. F10 str. 9ZD137]